MQDDLLRALRHELGDETSPQLQRTLEFATTSRSRAKTLADEVVATTGFDFRGKKVLDVGSAYGGMVIEAASRGAEAYGVEISRKLWEYSKLAARGEPGTMQLVPGNFTSAQVGKVLPHDFDFVFVNDVFEHIYDTAGLLEQLHRVTVPGAGMYFSIPNGDCVKFVESEGHYGVAGVSLIPPNWWHAFVPSFTAFYRPWSFYVGLFKAFGFDDVRAWNPSQQHPMWSVKRRINAGVEKSARAIRALPIRDENARAVVGAAFEEYKARVAEDLAAGDLDLLYWRYLIHFWEGVAYRTGPALASDAAARARPETAPAPAAFRAIELASLPPDALVSTWTKRTTVEITHADGAVRCAVTGTGDVSSGQYGGIRIPTGPLGEVRLDLEFVGADNIESIYVDGEDPRRCRLLRWKWGSELGLPTARATYTFEPGKDAGRFAAREASMPGLVSELQLYVRVVPGTRATIVVHRAEVR